MLLNEVLFDSEHRAENLPDLNLCTDLNFKSKGKKKR